LQRLRQLKWLAAGSDEQEVDVASAGEYPR
jgi:hypothetical protein